MELIALPMRVSGVGAVSPAGWGVAALMDAVRSQAALPHEDVHRVDGAPLQRIRRVPKPAQPLPFSRDPRVRRTSPITGFIVAAALEAMGGARVLQVQAGRLRLGVIVVLLNGCVAFSRRFYGEVRDNPGTASPLIFPETVFNAPASHLAAILGADLVNYTLVGDTAQFAAALDLAASWLETGEASGVLIVGAEESDWLSGEAMTLFDRSSIVAEGAGALYLEPCLRPEIVFQSPVPIGHGRTRLAAARQVRETWRNPNFWDEDETLLCDGLFGAGRAETAERTVFADWAGPRISPASILGDGLGARTAWQCVVASAVVSEGTARNALVSAIGSNQQALGVSILAPAPRRS